MISKLLLVLLGTLVLAILALGANQPQTEEKQPNSSDQEQIAQLKRYLVSRDSLWCLLNANLCIKRNDSNRNESLIKKKPCLSGSPLSNCSNNKNNQEDHLHDRNSSDDLHNPGK